MTTLSQRLTRRALVGFALGAMALAAPRVSSAQTQPTAPLSARRFSIVLRVVRPKWRDGAAVPMPIHPHVLNGTQFAFKHADSDAEFPKELRVNNAFFTFDSVVSKRTLTLRGDQGWQAPANFTRQTLWLGVVDNDREMLRNHMEDLKPAGAQQGATTTPDGAPFHPAPPPAYVFDFTEKVQRDLLQKGMLLLSFRFTQSYVTEDGPVEYIKGNLIHFMNNGETTCLVGASLPVLDANGNSQAVSTKNETLMPSEVIFATVTEIK